MKSGDGKSQRREEKKKEDQRREIQKKEDPGARKGRKVAIHSVFPKICGSGGSKSRLAKAAGAEPCGQMRDKELHAVVAWITFASEKAKNTARSEHFWKLWCRKSAKHIPKSKCTKHTMFGPLLEVEMSKNCTPVWRKAHFQVKSGKNWGVRSTFSSWDVEKVYAVVVQTIFPSQKWKKLTGSEHFWIQISFRVAGARDCAPRQKWAKREGSVAVSATTTPLHYNYNYNYITLHYTNYITLHYTPLHSTPLH